MLHHLGGPFHRYWLPATRGMGVGVTACTEAEALAMAMKALALLPPGAELTGEIIGDPDVPKLDAQLGRAHMGQPGMHGVWYPRFD